jgi:hypothetical protein
LCKVRLERLGAEADGHHVTNKGSPPTAQTHFPPKPKFTLNINVSIIIINIILYFFILGQNIDSLIEYYKWREKNQFFSWAESGFGWLANPYVTGGTRDVMEKQLSS